MYNSRCINPENTHQIDQCRLLEGGVHCKTIKWKDTQTSQAIFKWIKTVEDITKEYTKCLSIDTSILLTISV